MSWLSPEFSPSWRCHCPEWARPYSSHWLMKSETAVAPTGFFFDGRYQPICLYKRSAVTPAERSLHTRVQKARDKKLSGDVTKARATLEDNAAKCQDSIRQLMARLNLLNNQIQTAQKAATSPTRPKTAHGCRPKPVRKSTGKVATCVLDLNDDVLLEVIKRLNIDNIVLMRQSCKILYRLTSSQEVWKPLLSEWFGSPPVHKGQQHVAVFRQLCMRWAEAKEWLLWMRSTGMPRNLAGRRHRGEVSRALDSLGILAAHGHDGLFHQMLDLGCAQSLFSMSGSDDRSLQHRAIQAIGHMAMHEAGRQALCRLGSVRAVSSHLANKGILRAGSDFDVDVSRALINLTMPGHVIMVPPSVESERPPSGTWSVIYALSRGGEENEICIAVEVKGRQFGGEGIDEGGPFILAGLISDDGFECTVSKKYGSSGFGYSIDGKGAVSSQGAWGQWSSGKSRGVFRLSVIRNQS